MSILASLARAYQRLPNAPPFGFSPQNIGVIVGLNEDGTVASVSPWLDGEGKKRKPRPMLVPQPEKRTVAIAPNFLWDKSSYVLGVTAGEGKRSALEHQAFKERHERDLSDADDAGLLAFLRFLRLWTPEQFSAPLWTEEMKDQNIVFALESDRREKLWLHDRPAAKALWARVAGKESDAAEICLVSGEPGPVARLHPSIKGVWGAQSSGAALVSFNLDAFTSYGHEQGDNAPISEASAFAYTTALNRFLERDSRHRIQIGDASTVFWADASDMDTAALAEVAFGGMVDTVEEERAGAKEVAALLERLRQGEPLEEVAPKLAQGIRFHVLGLAPNAARLSIRFYLDNDFGVLARNYQRFVSDMRVEPPPREPYPPLWRYLREVAVLGKSENVPPNLAGEWMRSILTGTRYPMTLSSAVLGRIRADGEVNALRIGILRALLVRNFRREPGKGDKEREAPVAFDPTNPNKGYLLGRLFAVYEQAQTAALGRNVNATIKDKFYGSASATPRNVFRALDSGSANHLSKIRKTLGQGRHDFFQKTIGSIMELMSPGEDPFPKSLGAEEQALFGLGYYHQRQEFFRKRETPGPEESAP